MIFCNAAAEVAAMKIGVALRDVTNSELDAMTLLASSRAVTCCDAL